jgi:hypothetical protein
LLQLIEYRKSLFLIALTIKYKQGKQRTFINLFTIYDNSFHWYKTNNYTNNRRLSLMTENTFPTATVVLTFILPSSSSLLTLLVSDIINEKQYSTTNRSKIEK